MASRTWKNIDKDKAEKIKRYLLEKGGSEQRVKSEHEAWQIKLSDASLTYYKKGTLFSTESVCGDSLILKAWDKINSYVGSVYTLPTKDFLIGLDETGKGEIVGDVFLCAAVFPKDIFKDIDLLIGSSDTKKRHSFGYWDELFKKLSCLKESGLFYAIKKITPSCVDKYNLNKIMDINYQEMLSSCLKKIKLDKSRIVIDDYGVGKVFRQFLSSLEKKGCEIIVTSNSEDKYLETKLASLISKRERQETIEKINCNKKFRINGLSVGSGNAGDKQTLDWLRAWYGSGKKWPWFIKKSFKTISQIEASKEKPKKENPF